MARHKYPEERAKLTGSDKKNPERFRAATPKSSLPLGNPPDRMGDDAQAMWFEIAAYCLPGVMTGSDRMMLEIVSNLMADYVKDPDKFAATKYNPMIGLLARFGLSPSDRRGLGIANPAAEKDEFAPI